MNLFLKGRDSQMLNLKRVNGKFTCQYRRIFQRSDKLITLDKTHNSIMNSIRDFEYNLIVDEISMGRRTYIELLNIDEFCNLIVCMEYHIRFAIRMDSRTLSFSLQSISSIF